ncbi:hypothetical protein J4573_44430 [Actinomadura barringtoniae]|uniref:RAMA domain-containing protein n=1 Tax=Actinomadura barringtoniae TaxID=1427535 RepID=A0A939PKA6_9ACTN|nr:type I restriction enzyme HsdR N-terminal domain-containing protein [Actinomadura barringtoniae]MBO2454200.1 hypothetical protein [Actinomadura barringtoniae]
MESLGAVVARCVDRLNDFDRDGLDLIEDDTRAVLIDPVIQALGWDIYQPREVRRSYRRAGWENPVDYALLISGQPRLFVEAKAITKNLDDHRWIAQSISYATVAGVPWVALTNAREWRIYNTHAPVPAAEKLFKATLTASDEASNLLHLLSKASITDGTLDAQWHAAKIDEQVRATLTELICGPKPHDEAVSLISRHTTGLSAHDIRASLAHLRPTFESEKADRGPDASELPAQPTQPSAGLSQTAGSRAPSINDLLRTGRLRAGTKLEATYAGQALRAELLENGHIKFNGGTHPSLTAASVAAKKHVNPDLSDRTASTNGWDFWRSQDLLTGDTVALRVIRQRLQRE